MRGYILPGILGLFLGLMGSWCGLVTPAGLRNALGLRRSYALRSALYALGAAMAMTALLCWLAMIDVDSIDVYPLSGGVLMAGGLFGLAAGLSGFTPLTGFAGAAHHPLEALCVIAGALLTVQLPLPEGLFADLPPRIDATLFRVTLDEPFLLGGGFLGQACAGLLLMALAMCIPSPRVRLLTDEEILRRAQEASSAEDAPPPEEAPADTFVASLPGEEPLVVDTGMDEESAGAENETASDETEDTAEDVEDVFPNEPAEEDMPAEPADIAPLADLLPDESVAPPPDEA